MMHRRHFLGTFATLAAGMTIDPERLLWVPGQRSYFDIRRQSLGITEYVTLRFQDGRVMHFATTQSVPVERGSVVSMSHIGIGGQPNGVVIAAERRFPY